MGAGERQTVSQAPGIAAVTLRRPLTPRCALPTLSHTGHARNARIVEPDPQTGIGNEKVSAKLGGLFRCRVLSADGGLAVGLPGLEPGTSSLSEMRSNQLSYRPGVIAATVARRRDNVQHAHVADKPIAGPGGGK